MQQNEPYCVVCGDPLVRVDDATGASWWVHVHMRHDDHKVVPAYDREAPWTMVDLWLGIMVLVGSATWFLTR